MSKSDVQIVREIEIKGNESTIDMFILEIQLELEEDEYITLPLKRTQMTCYGADGKPTRALVTIVDTSKKIRIIKLN